MDFGVGVLQSSCFLRCHPGPFVSFEGFLRRDVEQISSFDEAVVQVLDRGCVVEKGQQLHQMMMVLDRGCVGEKVLRRRLYPVCDAWFPLIDLIGFLKAFFEPSRSRMPRIAI